MLDHWALAYLGRSYDRAGVGPDSFNCWTFFRTVQREVFGRATPDIPYSGILSHIRSFMAHTDLQYWPVVDTPIDGDAVLLSGRNRPTHIGVWAAVDGSCYGGCIVHCDEGTGVVAQAVGDMDRRGWRVTAYRRYVPCHAPNSMTTPAQDRGAV